MSAKPCDDCSSALTELRERMTTVETQVGKTPDEGVRGDLRELRGVLRALELRGYMVAGGAIVVIWLIEHFLPKT